LVFWRTSIILSCDVDIADLVKETDTWSRRISGRAAGLWNPKFAKDEVASAASLTLSSYEVLI
jgi:hypothetical protein